MKSLNLCLIILNIISFPALATAESSLNINIKVNAPEKLISHVNLNSPLTEDKPEPEKNSETDKVDSEKKIENVEKNSADSSREEPESEIKDEDIEENSDSEEKEKVKKPTPEEIARLEKLAAADKLYLAGDKKAAVKLYRQAKPLWPIEKQESTQFRDKNS